MSAFLDRMKEAGRREAGYRKGGKAAKRFYVATRPGENPPNRPREARRIEPRAKGAAA